MTDTKYLTSKQAADLIGCHWATIGDLVKRGHFPNARKLDPTKRNSPYRLPLDEVEKFIKTQYVGK